MTLSNTDSIINLIRKTIKKQISFKQSSQSDFSPCKFFHSYIRQCCFGFPQLRLSNILSELFFVETVNTKSIFSKIVKALYYCFHATCSQVCNYRLNVKKHSVNDKINYYIRLYFTVFLLARSNTRDIPFSNILISKKQFLCNK